ncbi:MAG: GatB/YqeY domain-containing protein [Bacteroidia bacterium]|nr:GatB/YqeY domain-containing protein [Bacteroidia bacterium]
MGIEEKINADIKAAMLAKESKKLEALRAIKSVVLLLKTSPEGLTEESAIKSLQKEVKKRQESADIYKQQNRPDLAEAELYQAEIISQYLPKALSPEELEAEVKTIIAETGAKTAAEIGKVMGAATKKLAGKADNKAISEIARKLLSA